MEAPVIGTIPGGVDTGSAPAPSTQTQTRARPGDFAARMEQARNEEIGGFGGAPSQIQRRDPDVDPSVTNKAVQPDEGDSIEPYDEDQGAEAASVEAEYTDPTEVARQDFMTRLEQYLSQGRAPMDMLGDLLITKKLPNGREVDVTLSELDRGYMRQNDYTRRLHDAQQLASQANHIIALEQNRNRAWQNEDVLFRDLMNMGLMDTLDRLLMRYAEEKVRFHRLPEAERQRILLQRQAEQQRLQYEQRIAQLEARVNQVPEQDKQAEATRHFQNQLNQMLPPAFKKWGLRIYPESTKVFVRNMQVLYEQAGGTGPCTPQLVDEACSATKLEMEDQAVLAAQAAGQRRQLPTGLRPRPMSGGVGPGVQNAQGNGKRRRPSEFNQKFSSTGF